MDWVAERAKAVIAAVVGFGAVWVNKRWGIQVSPELEATITAAILGAVVYLVPNKAA